MIDVINPELFLASSQDWHCELSCIFLFPVIYASWVMIHDLLCVPIFVHVVIAMMFLMLRWVNSFCIVTLLIPDYSFWFLFVSWNSAGIEAGGVCLTCLFVPPLALHLLVMPSSSSCVIVVVVVVALLLFLRFPVLVFVAPFLVITVLVGHCHTLLHGCVVTSSLPACKCCIMHNAE